jgi:hypothetical protein
MTAERLHPFRRLFGPVADERFPAIREATGSALPSLDAFLLAAPAIELLRDLRPDPGPGDAIDEFVALVHAGFCFWASGALTRRLDRAATHAVCAPGNRPGSGRRSAAEGVCYIQLAPNLVWGRFAMAAAFEPLDGCFVLPAGAGLRVVACFGLHPGRPGISVATIEGARPILAARPDRSPLFVPVMPGGEAAGLHSITSFEELLLLAWRAADLAEPA